MLAETEYACAMGKGIYGLLLEPHYAPEGWLLQALNEAKVLDFSSDEALGTSLPLLIRELGPRARVGYPGEFDGEASLIKPRAGILRKKMLKLISDVMTDWQECNCCCSGELCAQLFH